MKTAFSATASIVLLMTLAMLPRPCLAQTPGITYQVSLALGFEPPHWLAIRGAQLPGAEIRINYLEAYCRADSRARDGKQRWIAWSGAPSGA